MAVGSGIAAQLGLAAETVFGTFAAPARFHRVSKFEIKKKKNVVQGGGLAAGQALQVLVVQLHFQFLVITVEHVVPDTADQFVFAGTHGQLLVAGVPR